MSENRPPSSERAPADRPRSRVGLVAVGVAALVAAGIAVTVAVSGGDRPAVPAEVDEDAYCLVLSADYEASLRSIIDPASIGQTRDVVVPTVQRIYAGFVASAPPRFRAQARELVEGIDRTIDGELGPGELDVLIGTHAGLQEASRDLCSSRPGVTPEPP